MKDVAEFLRGHPPFDGVGDTELERVAAEAEIEFHRSGTTVFRQGDGQVDHLRVVRTGSVEIVHDNRVLDLLGPGELFGHTPMLSGLPAGFSAVAAEDTLCYRIPAEVATPVLGAPGGLRYVARSLQAHFGPARLYAEQALDPARRPVRDLIRSPLVTCPPDTPVREAARRMTEAGTGATVVELRNGTWGIVTDRDLRQRVVADGLGLDVPVSAVMTAPAYTVTADRTGAEVLLDMLDRGIRHLPVLSATGEVLGVVEDVDLTAAAARSSFHLRTAIARARTVDELVAASVHLRPMVVTLHDARSVATELSAMYSVEVDALTRRLVELTVRELGEPTYPFAWLALGSMARREAVLSSDVDSALVWFGPHDDDVARHLHAIADRVVAGLAACGVASDDKGVVANKPLFARSYDGWQSAARRWLADPSQDRVLLLASLTVDGRPVWGIRSGPPVPDVFRDARRHPEFLRLLARLALTHRPPTGFLRDFVVEQSGERRGTLDLKRGGVMPIADLARWAGMLAGVTSASTPARLRAAAAAGTLAEPDAETLCEAFELVTELRLDHQVEQVRAGLPPDDHVEPAALNPVTRGALKEAFRAVADVQRRVSGQLRQGVL